MSRSLQGIDVMQTWSGNTASALFNQGHSRTTVRWSPKRHVGYGQCQSSTLVELPSFKIARRLTAAQPHHRRALSENGARPYTASAPKSRTLCSADKRKTRRHSHSGTPTYDTPTRNIRRLLSHERAPMCARRPAGKSNSDMRRAQNFPRI